MPYEFLKIEKEDTIAVITLDRPPVNALNLTAYQEIYDAFRECQFDDSVGAVVFTAVGEKVFTAGLDVKQIAGKSLPEAIAFQMVSRRCLDMIARIRKPTIAAIFGYVLGGALELALACDLRISTPDATIGCPEINLGIIAGSGGTQRLPRLIGMSKAKELLFSGESVKGEEAHRIGLVNRIAPKETLQNEARAWAKKARSKTKSSHESSQACNGHGYPYGSLHSHQLRDGLLHSSLRFRGRERRISGLHRKEKGKF